MTPRMGLRTALILRPPHRPDPLPHRHSFPPEWRQEMTTPELTVSALADWLRKQEPETTYCFGDPWDCLVYRYMKAGGAADRHAVKGILPGVIDRVARHGGPLSTYGAALSRAEAILARGGE